MDHVSARTRACARAFAAVMVASVAGCAGMLEMQPTQFAPLTATTAAREIRIVQAATVMPSSRFPREVPAGSRWRVVGRLPQGDVYKRIDGVFNVEARHFHEAYLVVDGTRLQGFYLPVEEKYSPALLPIQLNLGGNP